MIKRDLTKTTLNISQPDLITNTTQGFNEDVKQLMIYNNLDTKYKGIVHNQEKVTKVLYDIHKRYRSGVGLLLYTVKYSRPELSNVVREISKCIDEANMRHYKALLCSIK